ncbi:MAG: RtcB family protein [Thermoplasmata archaeon]
MNIQRIDDFTYMIEKESGMNVPGIIYSSEKLMEQTVHDGSLEQVVNVARLPGIVKASLAMPDIHLGYGFPIGGVAAFDSSTGIISPGGVGYDINCGVALLISELEYREIGPHLREMTDKIFEMIPSGLTSRKGISVDRNNMRDILSEGLKWAVRNGYGNGRDAEHTEDSGSLETSYENVSKNAVDRGMNQIGTLGAGNHFLEVQKVGDIFDPETSKKFGLFKDEVTVMIHTGSRGLGHQVATDYMKRLSESSEAIKTGDMQLISAPIDSKIGSEYISAMKAAANFAFVNREIVIENIRKVFKKETGSELKLLYSLAHNIAKEEYHTVDRKKVKLMVHRKGATRAFPRGHISGPFEDTGQPVLIPGSMGTASYVLVGMEENMELSFGTSCHGAGRRLSRSMAVKEYSTSVENDLKEKGIYAHAASKKVLSEEAPGSYKDVDEVINAVSGSRLARPVARMIPLSVVKG